MATTFYTKTTLNFANKRNIDLTEEDFASTVSIWVTNEHQPSVVYFYNEDTGVYTYKHNFDLPQEVKEELPATIYGEKQLRQVLTFLVDNVECNGL